MSDVRDILNVGRGSSGPRVTKEDILGTNKKKVSLLQPETRPNGRPEGMARELFALLDNGKKDVPPVIETEIGKLPTYLPGRVQVNQSCTLLISNFFLSFSDGTSMYKQKKAKLGIKRVRPWEWAPFVNTAREDGVKFNHWRRVADKDKEYPFAQFNKVNQNV